MDIILAEKRLPPPTDIRIGYTKAQGQCLITWNNLAGTDEKVFYNIYRGISHNGIFYKQNLQPIAINKFIDYNLGKHPNITYWYKVSSCYYLNGQLIEGKPSSPVQYSINNMNRWFNKMNERNMWILKMDGLLFDLYTRKYEGERCPDCYSETRGRAGQNSCTTCFGTGFVGGYSPQVQLYVRLAPVEEAVQINTEGYQYQRVPSAWTITPIHIRNRDILISPEGSIFSVTASYINQAAGYYFHQDLKLRILEPNDPLYQMKRYTLKPAY